MFLSASVTGGGVEPKNFLMMASWSGNTSVCILYLLERNCKNAPSFPRLVHRTVWI